MSTATKAMKWLVGCVVALVTLLGARAARAERVRDLVEIAGARDNQLIGYGIVTGLTGTGDDVSAPFAAQSTLALLRRLGVQIDARQLRLRNVAAVTVIATLPAFAKPGTKLDVTVSSVGNARSLANGTLVQSILMGADQHAYAVAQGPIVIGGFEAKGASGSSVKSGALNVGRIPGGGLVEREVVASLVRDGKLRLDLRTPGFALAARVVEAVEGKLGKSAASAVDSGAVVVKVPPSYENNIVELVALLEDLEVTVVRRARVVINERTGTIVAGGDVRLSPAAVVHGGITIVVKEAPVVSQPRAPLIGQGGGSTVVVPRTDVDVNEHTKSISLVPAAATLADVVSALGALGLSPRELTSVLQAFRSAGALEAEVVIQ